MSNGLIKTDDPQATAEAISPHFLGARKSRYLSFRACGFSIRESCHLADISHRTVESWRQNDPDFKPAEQDAVTTIRSRLSKEHLELEFTRNFAAMLHKDFMVISRSIAGQELSDQDHKYLLKARNYYTPQQLHILHQLLGKSIGQVSFADIVVRLSETKREISIEPRPELVEVIDGASGESQ